MSARDDLKAEALALGLTFKGNISNVKLKALVESAGGDSDPIAEKAPPSPAVKKGSKTKVETDSEPAPITHQDKARAKQAIFRKKVATARAQAFKTSIVTITNKDNRENDFMTTVYLSFENQYFGLSKSVPLDVPVELENALLAIAASTSMTLHKDEIVDGKRTGNKIATTVKKFAISYARKQPK